MQRTSSLLFAGLLPFFAAGAEIPAPVTDVMIFRNGDAVVRHEADPKGERAFTVRGNFAPVEGTLWASPNVYQIRKVLSKTEKKKPVPLNDITGTYKGQFVTLHLTDEPGKAGSKVSGTVLDLYTPMRKELEQANVSFLWDQIVAVKCSDGKILAVNRHRITGVESASLKIGERTVKEEHQAWEFTMAPEKGGKAVFDYISRSLSWVPALKMTLLPGKKMLLDFAAAVSNSGDDLANVRCILWAGSPNLVNAGRVSFMSISKPTPVQPFRPMYLRNDVAMKGAGYAEAAYASDSACVPAAPGLSGNMAPFDFGRLTLKKGEALTRQLGSGSGTYENLVRWRIGARHGDDGIRVWRNNFDYNNKLWECLSFANPLKYPLPDCAVEVADGPRVLAQVKGEWVNSGEKAVLEVAKCQDVRGTIEERELPSSIKNRGQGIFQQVTPANGRQPALGRINGVCFRVTDVAGTLKLKNYRKAPVKLVIELDYFGEFVSASGEPEKKLLNHVGTLNPKNQLRWELEMKPGESREFTYRYNVIISR